MSPLLKPETCSGCPLRTLGGAHWVPDEVREGTEVFLLYQNPGKHEIEGQRMVSRAPRTFEPCSPAPLTGATGYDLEQFFLPLAGLDREHVSLGNVYRCRIGDRDELPYLTSKSPDMKAAAIHCQRAHFRPPKSVRLFVAGGEYALFALTGEGGGSRRTLSSWRGWLLPYNPPPRPHTAFRGVYTPSPGGTPVLVHYHLAYLYQAPWERPTAVQDWRKVRWVLDGRWPEPFPPIWTTPPPIWPTLSAFDTEYVPSTGWWLRYSLAYRDKEERAKVWVVEEPHKKESPMASGRSIRVIMHNTLADYPYLTRILPSGSFEVEDTMFLFHALWSDLDHTLDYLASLHARTNGWKHLEETNPQQYSAGDALGTYDSFVAIAKEAQRDPASEQVYRRRLALLPIWLRAQAVGVATNPERIREVLALLGSQKDAEQLKAEAAVGWPLNLGSPSQVAHRLYDVERVHLHETTGRPRRRG